MAIVKCHLYGKRSDIDKFINSDIKDVRIQYVETVKWDEPNWNNRTVMDFINELIRWCVCFGQNIPVFENSMVKYLAKAVEERDKIRCIKSIRDFMHPEFEQYSNISLREAKDLVEGVLFDDPVVWNTYRK